MSICQNFLTLKMTWNPTIIWKTRFCVRMQPGTHHLVSDIFLSILNPLMAANKAMVLTFLCQMAFPIILLFCDYRYVPLCAWARSCPPTVVQENAHFLVLDTGHRPTSSRNKPLSFSIRLCWTLFQLGCVTWYTVTLIKVIPVQLEYG